jgi:hypothetical protein
MSIRSKCLLLPLMMLLSLALSGCISINTSIFLRQDGSGELSITAGAPTEYIAMLPQDEKPMAEIEQQFREQLGEETAIEQFSEGGYEWRKARRPFSTLDEINALMNKLEFVQSFSIQKQRSLLKDHFVLDAVFELESLLATIEGNGEEAYQFPADLKGLAELKVSAYLPGTISETNGEYDSDSGYVLWSISGTDPLQVHAASETWNLIQVGLLAALGLAFIFLFVLFILMVKRIMRRKAMATESANVAQRLVESVQGEEPLSEILQASEEEALPIDAEAVISPSKILAEIGARQLLEQVNLHVFKGAGEISTAKGAIRLIWSDPQDETVKRGIMIRVQGVDTLLINGQPFPATREGAKQGLISCLKGMEKE